MTNDPSDSGGRTQYGISERAHPDVWRKGFVTYDEARAIYTTQYFLPFTGITDLSLLHQLVDIGVPSGPATAARILQQLVGVEADGKVGPRTLSAVDRYPGGTLFGHVVPGSVLLNLAVRDARVMLYAGIVKRRPKDLKFLLGWLNRTFTFR